MFSRVIIGWITGWPYAGCAENDYLALCDLILRLDPFGWRRTVSGWRASGITQRDCWVTWGGRAIAEVTLQCSPFFSAEGGISLSEALWDGC